MTVSIWRLGATVGPYKADDMSGAASARVGGRYNSIGTAVVYTSANVSLTILETVVHMAVKARNKVSNRYLIEIEVPDAVFAAREVLTIAGMAKKRAPFWDAIPFGTDAQHIGDNFVKKCKSLLLEAPSAIISHKGVPDVNYLINPAHPDFSQLVIVRRDKFTYDPRII